MHITYKQYEDNNQNLLKIEDSISIRKKLVETGMQPNDIIKVSDSINPNKYLISYLITKCKPIHNIDLSTIYSTKSLGQVLYIRDTGSVFIEKGIVDNLKLIGMTTNEEKEFYKNLK